VVLVGQSGSGKSSLLNVVRFLPMTVRCESTALNCATWTPDAGASAQLGGQNPQLPAATLRENVLLAWPEASEAQLQAALDSAWVSEFISLLPQG
jgi:ATP-binding cassette subfamily C protein CydD